MKRLEHSLLILLFLACASTFACKKVTVGNNKGAAGGAAADAKGPAPEKDEVDAEASAALLDEAAETELGGEAEEPAEGETAEPQAKQVFNMVKYIRSKKKLESMWQYTDEAGTQLSMGDQKFFKIETNGTLALSPDFDKAEAERKITGAYWMKAYAAGKALTNAANTTGLFLDIGAEATLDKLNIDMHFRYVGVDIASRSILAGFDQSFMRNYEYEAAYVVVLKAKANLGGEMGMKGEFGIRRDNVLNFLYTPRVNVLGGVAVGVDLIVAGAFLAGEVRLLNLAMKGSANVGIVKDSGLVYADIGLDQNDLRLVEGRLDVITNLFGQEVRRDKIWAPDPLAILKLPVFSTTMVKFFKKPASESVCKTATDAAAIKLAGNVEKMKAYQEVAAVEDQYLVKAEIKRMGLIYKQVQEICGGSSGG